jgi:protein NrfD
VTYYGQPALKPSPFDWVVAAYMWTGGLGAAAQLLSTLADAMGGSRWGTVVRRGRDLGSVSSLVGGLLLVGDLKTPGRWYNMLRIFRGTSPMSIGSWILTAFGALSGIASMTQHLRARGLLGVPRAVTRAAQIPAAAAGLGMMAYTGGVLAATSTPLWAASPRLLSARFVSSAMASGASALALGEWSRGAIHTGRALDRITMAALAAELGFTLAAERAYARAGVEKPLAELPWNLVDRIGGTVIGGVVPLACLGLNALRSRPSPALSIGASIAVLVGGMCMRQAMLYAGNKSAQRPTDYFELRGGGRPGEGRRR